MGWRGVAIVAGSASARISCAFCFAVVLVRCKGLGSILHHMRVLWRLLYSVFVLSSKTNNIAGHSGLWFIKTGESFISWTRTVISRHSTFSGIIINWIDRRNTTTMSWLGKGHGLQGRVDFPPKPHYYPRLQSLDSVHWMQQKWNEIDMSHTRIQWLLGRLHWDWRDTRKEWTNSVFIANWMDGNGNACMNKMLGY